MTETSYRRSARAIAGRPIYTLLATFPAACFTLTLMTDIAFWKTSNVMWQNFSAWLLLAGLVFGALAAIVRLVDFLAHAEMRALGVAWAHAALGTLVLVLAILNSFVHAGDGWSAVVPYGLVLSAVTVFLMFVASWLGQAMTVRAFRLSNIYG